jgi:hypothetical protein
MLAEIEDFLGGFNQPTYRGMRVNGVRVTTWSSQRGMVPGKANGVHEDNRRNRPTASFNSRSSLSA